VVAEKSPRRKGLPQALTRQHDFSDLAARLKSGPSRNLRESCFFAALESCPSRILFLAAGAISLDIALTNCLHLRDKGCLRYSVVFRRREIVESSVEVGRFSMRNQGSDGLLAFVVLLMLALSSIQAAQAQTFNVLYTFNGQDGLNPIGSLVRDDAGNLYGTTFFGGPYTNGVAFKLTESGEESTLFNFNGGSEGGFPNSSLILDQAGNLYGPAGEGVNGGGVLFKLSPKGKEKVLFNFGGCVCLQPRGPEGGLLMDASGNLYGATTLGGVKGRGPECELYGCGTIFRFDAATRKLQVLYAFKGGEDGAYPSGPLLQDAEGNFYGAAENGGDLSCPEFPDLGCGTLFKVASDGTFTVLHRFTGGADGAGPQPGLIMDAVGNLYGAAAVGGNSICDDGCGTLFKLSKAGKLTVLYTFQNGDDGGYPNGGLVRDSKGNLYGTTSGGTTNSFDGTVFKLSKAGAFTELHIFSGGTDGGKPLSGLIQDAAGNLYGTTYTSAGFNGPGVVFEVTP